MNEIRALAFDVFGTVVDWHGSIAREAEALLAPKGYSFDWGDFANDWRRRYNPAMEPVRTGARAYTRMDTLHREMLDDVLTQYGVAGLSEGELHDFSLAWRRLDPWPDAVAGMERLKRRFVVAAVSNGNIALVLAMAKRAGLPWDVILGADMARTFKPRAEIYDTAVELLGLEPGEVMMTACHPWDLDAAAKRGMRTAMVRRPMEYGPKVASPEISNTYDVDCNSFVELAERLGA